ncbi:MAG: hypothetical protein ACE5DM_00365 [Candidatus Nanoarchaeia archaeon]
MMMNKKAQFYLFTMVILLAIATTLVISKPVSSEVDQSFDLFFENVDREAEYVINNALVNGANITSELDIFFTHAQELAKVRRMQFDYFYLLVNDTHMSFSNNLESTVFVVDYNLTMAEASSEVIEREAGSTLAFQIQDGFPDLSSFIYKFQLTEENHQIRYVLLVKRGEEYGIHIRDAS